VVAAAESLLLPVADIAAASCDPECAHELLLLTATLLRLGEAAAVSASSTSASPICSLTLFGTEAGNLSLGSLVLDRIVASPLLQTAVLANPPSVLHAITCIRFLSPHEARLVAASLAPTFAPTPHLGSAPPVASAVAAIANAAFRPTPPPFLPSLLPAQLCSPGQSWGPVSSASWAGANPAATDTVGAFHFSSVSPGEVILAAKTCSSPTPSAVLRREDDAGSSSTTGALSLPVDAFIHACAALALTKFRFQHPEALVDLLSSLSQTCSLPPFPTSLLLARLLAPADACDAISFFPWPLPVTLHTNGNPTEHALIAAILANLAQAVSQSPPATCCTSSPPQPEPELPLPASVWAICSVACCLAHSTADPDTDNLSFFLPLDPGPLAHPRVLNTLLATAHDIHTRAPAYRDLPDPTIAGFNACLCSSVAFSLLIRSSDDPLTPCRLPNLAQAVAACASAAGSAAQFSPLPHLISMLLPSLVLTEPCLELAEQLRLLLLALLKQIRSSDGQTTTESSHLLLRQVMETLASAPEVTERMKATAQKLASTAALHALPASVRGAALSIIAHVAPDCLSTASQTILALVDNEYRQASAQLGSSDSFPLLLSAIDPSIAKILATSSILPEDATACLSSFFGLPSAAHELHPWKA
jgi:hypothetical protein